MYGTMALPRSVESPNSLCSQPGVDNVRHHTLPQNPDAYHAQRLALRKQCTAYYQHGRDLTSPNQQPQQPYLFADQYQRRLDYSPARREYERCAIPEERGLDESALRRIGDRSRSCDRYPRTLSPVSRFANTPSPLPRSLSRGSSRSCQSSSADESGREGGGGGASSSGIGLSGSSANSSRRASCCSSGTGSSRLTYHSNAVTLIGSNLSRDSINSRIYSGTPELTVKDVTPRSAAGDQVYYEESEQDQSARDDGDLKSSEPHCPQSMDSLENELTCPICLDLFHEPVLLPCAHNLCSGCVEQFFNTHGGNLSETPGSRVVFQCPTCREIVALDSRGVSALRRNLTLQNIVDSYRRAAATSPGARRNEFEDISDEESSASNISTQSDGSLGPSRSRRRMRHKELESKDYVHINGPATKLEVTTIQQPADEVVLCQFCDLEPARAAVKTCLTCRAYYCDRCLRVTHPRKKPFVNHKLVAATPGSAGTLSANHSTAPRQRTHATCFNHANEVADLYCANCELSLCKICSLATEHGNHVIHNVNDWCQKRKSELEHHVTGMTKQRAEVERIMNLFAEARQETENNAAAQDAKLQAECDTLIRIVNERREAIAAKIKETKGNRMRRLSQSLQAGKQCMESLDAAIAHASDIAQQEQNTARMVKDSKITTERINQALSSAKLVSTQAEALANPGFYLDFTQEKTLLDKLDILEAPAVPRICEELCTQSHDKVTIQWRSSDARHTEWYELQYAIDDRWSTPESPTDGWMIVPNIKESSYTIHGMQTGTRYVFAVKAVNKAGSTRSEIVTIKTLGMPFAFDTHSMHKKLRLANHGYTVSREDSNKKSKDSGSSSSLCGVSGNVSIEGGRHYWEVVVCQSTSFTLGVAYTNAPRFEWTGKNNMSWCLCRSNQEWSVRHDSKDIPVHLPSPFPKKIGVLLDYDTGVLSFFDGASGRRIHTFRIDFKRAIRPAFSVGNKSLTINTGITVPDQLQLPVESIYN